MSLTLRDVYLGDLETFRRWRADPRYATMLRRPGTPKTWDDAVEWFSRNEAGHWFSAVEDGRLRGYGMLMPDGEAIAEVSVLTDPDQPCDAEVLQLLVALAPRLGIRRLTAETYTWDRERLIGRAGFRPTTHWTLLLTDDPTASPATPAPESPPPR